MMVSKTIGRETYILTEGLLNFEFTERFAYDKESATETMVLVEEFLVKQNVEIVPLLVTANNCNPKMTFDARKVFASKESMKRYSCVAIVTQNHMHSIIGKLFIAMSNLPIPIKLFGKREDAMTWIEEVKASNLVVV